MRRSFTSFILLLSLAAMGQTNPWKPFKLCVIQPKSATIDKTLYSDRDSVESDNLKSYYTYLKRMEELLKFNDYSKEMEQSFKETQERLKTEIPQLKLLEDSVKKFKYFQTISQYSTQVYNFYFNEYKPYSTIVQIANHVTDLLSLQKLADTLKADYIVFYSNIHTEENGGILKLTTSLYSRKENRIIMQKETTGDTISRGSMWTCNQNVPLSCLLINGVRTSTNEVANILRKRQPRQK